MMISKNYTDGLEIRIAELQQRNAELAALVVELPSCVNDMDSAPMLYDSIVEQLDALGVRYE